MNREIDISNVTLKTERTLLRPWRIWDVDDLYEYARVEGVGEWAGWLPHKSRDESRRIVESFIAHKKVFAVEYEGRVIGSIGVEKYDEKEYPELERLNARELGYVLGKDYWGKGLMTEAAGAVLGYLFEDVFLDAVTCCHFVLNARSARVQEKLGFEFHHESVHETTFGEKRDTRCNLLTRAKYKGIKLVSPSTEYAQELTAFKNEVLLHDADDPNIFAGCFGLEESASAEEFISLCLKRQRDDWGKDDKMKVPSHTFLAVSEGGSRIVGVIDLRHHINHPILGTWGGHSGYTVRPSERGRGYAKEMLRQLTLKAREMGISPLLVTCGETNIASEKTILANGGIFDAAVETDCGTIKRYWISR